MQWILLNVMIDLISMEVSQKHSKERSVLSRFKVEEMIGGILAIPLVLHPFSKTMVLTRNGIHNLVC